MNKKFVIGIAIALLLFGFIAYAADQSAEQVGQSIGEGVGQGLSGVIKGLKGLKDELAKDPVIGTVADDIVAKVDRETSARVAIRDIESDSGSLKKPIDDFIKKEEAKLGVVPAEETTEFSDEDLPP